MEKLPKANKNNIEPSPSDRFIAVGLVRKACGIHGDFKVEPLSDFSERYKHLKAVFLEMKNGEMKSFEVERAQFTGHVLRMKLKGVEDRDSAEALYGAYMCVTRDEAFSLEENSYYVFELEGLEVFHSDGSKIGHIKRIEQYPANDVMVVETETDEIMIPAIKKYVTEIDINARRMVVNMLEGLPCYPKSSI